MWVHYWQFTCLKINQIDNVIEHRKKNIVFYYRFFQLFIIKNSIETYIFTNGNISYDQTNLFIKIYYPLF